MKSDINNTIIKKLKTSDSEVAMQLSVLFNMVFENKDIEVLSHNHFDKLLTDKNFIAFVSLYNSGVIGGITCYTLPMFTNNSLEIFIYDIAVLPAFQRNGIGIKLIEAVRDHAGSVGAKYIFVNAENADKHALNFYRKTGASEIGVTQFTYSI